MSATATTELRLVNDPAAVGSYMSVKLAGPTQESLKTPHALNTAKGIAGARGFTVKSQVMGSPEVFPVDEKGETTDALYLGQTPVHEWYGEFKFHAGL